MSGSIFGDNKEDKKKVEFTDKVNTHSKAILNVVERQKDLESTLDLLSEKLEMFDHNSIKNNKKSFKDMKDLRDDFRELKLEISKIKERQEKIIKQLKLSARQDDVAKLEKYIDLWNPMDFMTRTEIETEKSKNLFITQKDLEKSEERLKEEIKKILESFLKGEK